MPQPAVNLGKIPPYLFAEIDRKIAEAKARGVDIISLGVGDPDLPTPGSIVKAMQQAVADPSNHNYPPYHGTPEFREAAAAWMKTRFGVTVDANTETLSLIGSKEGLAHLILAYVNPGDVVLCPSPGYPVYSNWTLLVGGEPVIVPLLAQNHFLPDLSKIPADVAKRAKIFFLNYPNNPTGAIIDEAKIKEVVDFCRQHDILLCHDNAYSEMTFDGYKAPSFLSVPGAKDVCIEMFSLSKMYNMTGWRIGFAVGNEAAVQTLGKIKNNTDSGVFKAIQQASAVGLRQSEELTKDLNAIYARRRDIFVEGLNRMGWNAPKNEATFYLWIPVPTGMTSVEFVSMLLEKCGVVVPPGTGYGPEGEGFFRVALTVPEDRLKEALARMEK
ncbi:MAG TPA: LL-diaminopimelate aminotransferase [Coleofasciculaceae cyanobacterium]|jgi:LL-diaminopimelate aminotransferase